MKNILRTPWEIEPADRWPTLFSVYDCDGNVVAAAKIEEVARLIAGAPATKADYDHMSFTQEELDTVRVVMARLRLRARTTYYKTQATVDYGVLKSVLEKMESQTATPEVE